MHKETGDWYSSWFCTPYYHILYSDRDMEEAGFFMDNLISFLKIPKTALMLDLACGRGRHAVYLNAMGYDVTGVDLSNQNILDAQQHQKPGLRFMVHDMRIPMPSQFDAILNLFTSFGYFEDESDNLKTLAAIKDSLKPNGIGVIDFMNVGYLTQNLVNEEIKEIDGMFFNISRQIVDGFIQKDISFTIDGVDHHYKEKVQAIRLKEFKNYFKELNINLLHCFGNYDLQPYDEKYSERLILIFN